MKRYLVLAVAALAFVVAAPSAFAVRIRVVDAPPTPGQSNPPDCTSNSPNTACSITNLTDTYTINFVGAGQPGCQAAANATGVQPGDLDGFTYCAILNNLSGSPLTVLNFMFDVPVQGPNDDYNTVTCTGIPSSVSASFCPPVPLTVGDSITASFSASPGVPINQDAYLFIDFANTPGTTSLTLTPLSVPEPGELGLFGLGLLAIGVGYGWQKRRQSRGLMRRRNVARNRWK